MNTASVFSYGTLKKGEPNHSIIVNPNFGKSRFICKAKTLKKWPLVIASRFNIPFILDSSDREHIAGEVYEVDRPMLWKLDELECYPQFYDRIQELVLLLDNMGKPSTTAVVWMYVLKDFKPWMLELPRLHDYTSNGAHKLPYAPQYNASPTEIFSEVKKKYSSTLSMQDSTF